MSHGWPTWTWAMIAAAGVVLALFVMTRRRATYGRPAADHLFPVPLPLSPPLFTTSLPLLHLLLFYYIIFLSLPPSPLLPTSSLHLLSLPLTTPPCVPLSLLTFPPDASLHEPPARRQSWWSRSSRWRCRAQLAPEQGRGRGVRGRRTRSRRRDAARWSRRSNTSSSTPSIRRTVCTSWVKTASVGVLLDTLGSWSTG